MGKLIFITGGARSGKSNLARAMGEVEKGQVVFVATAQAGDREMKSRIRKHRRSRPRKWKTVEEPHLTAKKLLQLRGAKCLIIECLTLLISNLVQDGKRGDEKIRKELKALLEAAKRFPGKVIVVSNEVGGGVVPATKLGRRFRDLAGEINQMTAEKADEVYLVVAGIPVCLKGKKGT